MLGCAFVALLAAFLRSSLYGDGQTKRKAAFDNIKLHAARFRVLVGLLADRRITATLPLGIIANIAGIKGLMPGKHILETIGPEVTDKNGYAHLGIIQIPVPVLKADREKIKEIRQRLYQPEFAGLIVVDFSDVAQGCNVYDDYIQKAAEVEEAGFQYFGIGLCGDKKLINRLTGSLPLLR